MDPVKILIADDEPDILEFLGYNLRQEGYQVFTAANGKEAIQQAEITLPHLILLDIMMPLMDGIEACHEIRRIPALKDAIIGFLTARNEDYTQIAGFEAGADDYITKPIKPKVLIHRIKSLLRRHPDIQSKENLLEFDELVINLAGYTVNKGEEEIHLVRKEFELLVFLAQHPGKVFTRDQILSKVWGNEVIVGDRTIDVHIKRLREKLGEKFLKTVKGIGYKFDVS